MNKKDTRPLMVTIRCATYNQEPYIRQCLDGFVMQKTNFRFEAIVHDDASTDRTADIIREYAEKYPDIIKPIYETENQYSKHDGSLRRIMDTHTHGKYVAICEGDDYWIDPLKLQKQVDFLENHPEYGMVHGKVKVFIQKSNVFHKNTLGESFSKFEELLLKNKIVTNTVLFRSELYYEYCNFLGNNISGKWLMGDYPLWLYIAYNSKVFLLNDIVGVYRMLEESASHSNDLNKLLAFMDSTYSIQLFFSKLYNVDAEIRKILYRNYIFEKCTFLLKCKCFKRAWSFACSFSTREKISYIGYLFLRVVKKGLGNIKNVLCRYYHVL